jgi:hypothetical protein
MGSRSLNSALEEAGRRLAPTEDQCRYVDKVLAEVVRAIQQNGGRFGVDRVAVSGSKGKSTCLRTKFDVDLVVFVNDVDPPFEGTFDRIEDCLMLTFDDYSGTIGPFSLQCIIQGVYLDILLATNMVPPGATANERPARLQRKGLMHKFAGSEETSWHDVRPFSAAFCETVCDFLATQKEQVHAAIRLAKFWSKTLIWFDPKAECSLSYAIELLTCRGFEVAAAETEKRDPSMTAIFKQFLRQLVEWRTMQVICCTYYAENDIPASVKRFPPLLLDPANPWNNVARGLRWESWESLARFAATALEKLENPAVGFQDLFMVQFDPAGVKHIHGILAQGGLQVNRHLISQASGLTLPKDLFSTVEYDRGSITDEASRMLIDCVQRMAIAATYTSLLTTITFHESTESMVASLHTTVLRIPPVEWTATTDDRHQDRDVTIRIPCIDLDGRVWTGLFSFCVTGRRA